MRIINGLVYGIIFLLSAIWIVIRRKEEKELSKFYQYVKGHAYILIILFTVNSISFAMTFQNGSSTYIAKDGYNGDEKEIGFVLKKEDKTEEVFLKVRPRMLTEKEEAELMEEAFSYLKKNMKGENKSLSEVKTNLDFSIDYEKYPFDISVHTENYALLDSEGNLRNEKEDLIAAGYTEAELKNGILSKLQVELWYGDHSKEKDFEIRIFPKEEREIEKYFAKVISDFKKEEEKSLYKEGFSLPLQVEGVSIERLGDTGTSPMTVLVIGILLSGLLLLKEQEEKKQAEEKRREMLLRSYPWFVNELVLLLGAGMQMKNIFRVLSEEYKAEQKRNSENGKRKKKKVLTDYREPLMKEIEAAKNSIDFGMSEEQVYYHLGRRLKLPCYIKLMTLLEQNVKKGTKGLTETFEQEELAALEERKNLAKRYGEEAGTKMLGPMILLLIVIMLMILLPAFLSFGF